MLQLKLNVKLKKINCLKQGTSTLRTKAMLHTCAKMGMGKNFKITYGKQENKKK